MVKSSDSGPGRFGSAGWSFVHTPKGSGFHSPSGYTLRFWVPFPIRVHTQILGSIPHQGTYPGFGFKPKCRRKPIDLSLSELRF